MIIYKTLAKCYHKYSNSNVTTSLNWNDLYVMYNILPHLLNLRPWALILFDEHTK